MTQITHPAVTKYDLALLFTLIVLIDDRMGDLETENQRLLELMQAFHQARERYDTAYKQSSKSFLTEQIDKLDTVRDKLTKVIEWVARYWTELPDDEDAIRGRRVYQPFKDFEYRRDEALMAQNGKWQNIAQVLAQEPQATDSGGRDEGRAPERRGLHGRAYPVPERPARRQPRRRAGRNRPVHPAGFQQGGGAVPAEPEARQEGGPAARRRQGRR